jgi:flagellar assembly factor FliW
MKLATESRENKEVWVKPMDLTLTNGLIGFPEEREFELLVNADELPFMWIRAKHRKELGFVVIEPSHFVDDYEVEISDDDAKDLEIFGASDALVLNIVTIQDSEKIESATANLVGPILLNRNTHLGKQIIVSNHMKYSTKHPIISSSANG